MPRGAPAVFHRVGYKERLRSGKTLIQHIYDSHFAGVEQVEEMIDRWNSLAGLVDPEIFIHVAERLQDHSKTPSNGVMW